MTARPELDTLTRLAAEGGRTNGHSDDHAAVALAFILAHPRPLFWSWFEVILVSHGHSRSWLWFALFEWCVWIEESGAMEP